MPEILGLILMWIKKKRGGISAWVWILAVCSLVGGYYLQSRPRPVEVEVSEPKGPDLPAPLPSPRYTLPVVIPYQSKKKEEEKKPEPRVWMMVKEMPESLSPDRNREKTRNYTLFHRLFREAMVRKNYDESSTLALLTRLKEYTAEGKTTRDDIFEAIRAEFPNVSEFDQTRIFYTFTNTLGGIADAVKEENKKYSH